MISKHILLWLCIAFGVIGAVPIYVIIAIKLCEHGPNFRQGRHARYCPCGWFS